MIDPDYAPPGCYASAPAVWWKRHLLSPCHGCCFNKYGECTNDFDVSCIGDERPDGKGVIFLRRSET